MLSALLQHESCDVKCSAVNIIGLEQTSVVVCLGLNTSSPGVQLHTSDVLCYGYDSLIFLNFTTDVLMLERKGAISESKIVFVSLSLASKISRL